MVPRRPAPRAERQRPWSVAHVPIADCNWSNDPARPTHARAHPGARDVSPRIRVRESFVICPTCKRKISANPATANAFRPFCSERCRLVDLGAWLNGSHRITAPLSEEDLDEAVVTGEHGEDDERSEHN
ncbi:MAG: DNA gyrase inhibitor YacG [Deltaproteobacteria bacterium]|nr:DNA gyrase inhibitor YacG [Deltaproteobacteria bacterium]